jgi:putative flippase GtrA
LILQQIIDFFYPPFRKFFPLQIFRYGITGVANVSLSWVLYYLTFHFILKKEMLFLGFITISSHIASLFIVMPITFASGFLLQKYVTFTNSQLRGWVQTARYLEVFVANILLNYFGMKFFVDLLNLYPTPSLMLVTVVTTIFSYLMQKYYSFKTEKKNE